jgi:hypothetical protein
MKGERKREGEGGRGEKWRGRAGGGREGGRERNGGYLEMGEGAITMFTFTEPHPHFNATADYTSRVAN